MRKRTAVALALITVLLMQAEAFSHGLAGSRFFPTTFQVEDPFVSDEFSLLGSRMKLNGDSGQSITSSSLSAEWSKRVTESIGFSAGETCRNLHTEGDGSVRGYENLEVNAKYQFFTSAQQEAILAVGLSDEIGGTGNRKVSNSFSVISPAFYFGKGFGGLFGRDSVLRPLAVTGTLAVNFPTRPQSAAINDQTGEIEVSRNPTTLTWAFSLQYSLMYLQSSVKDIGLAAPLDRMIVIVEFPMETCINRGCAYETTGTANPGVVWIGKRVEMGLAAQIPLNEGAGKRIGALALFHVFIDDLFPRSIGRPVLQ